MNLLPRILVIDDDRAMQASVTYLWRLRKKIGDNGEAPRWIKKAQGEGCALFTDD